MACKVSSRWRFRHLTDLFLPLQLHSLFLGYVSLTHFLLQLSMINGKSKKLISLDSSPVWVSWLLGFSQGEYFKPSNRKKSKHFLICMLPLFYSRSGRLILKEYLSLWLTAHWAAAPLSLMCCRWIKVIFVLHAAHWTVAELRTGPRERESCHSHCRHTGFLPGEPYCQGVYTCTPVK